MNHTANSPLAVGFYGQIYNDIVRPNQIWRVSRYFIRRWGPILEPSRFWAVVAARHLSYLSEEQGGGFKAWDNEIAGEANLSNSHYRRLKGEMGDGDSPLAIFLKKGSLNYIQKGDGRVRKGRTRYTVRLDDPLTPADARQVETALRGAGLNRSTQPEEMITILKGCRELDKNSFLAADSELTGGVYGGWQAIYVSDIVEAITSKKLGQHVAVAEQAEALHSWLTSGDVIGRRYFRDSWLPVVGAGPAWLLSWLRSYCFLDETTGEIRDELAFSKIELAERLGIHKNALNRWLKALERIPEQPFSFVKELSRAKQPDNSVLVTFKIGMLEPLTAVDLERFDWRTEEEGKQSNQEVPSKLVEPLTTLTPNPSPILGRRELVLPVGENGLNSQGQETFSHGERVPALLGGEGINGAAAQNERYECETILVGTHTDERYKMGDVPVLNGGAVQNGDYGNETDFAPTHLNERGDTPSAQIERDSVTPMNGSAHTFEQNDILVTEQGPQKNGGSSSIERVSAPKGVHLLKHLKNLSTLAKSNDELDESDFALLEAAVAVPKGIGFDSGESIAQTLFGTPADFLRSIGADSGGGLTQQLIRAEVPLVTLAAWWLYALAEPGIRQPVPFVLKRASGGHIAPETFVQLAGMSLDAWLTHMLAFELDLPNDLAGRGLWEEVYADYSPEQVPFVGKMVCVVLDLVGERGKGAENKDQEMDDQQAQWGTDNGQWRMDNEPSADHCLPASDPVGATVWQKVLEHLAGGVSEMELEIFLKPARLVFEAGGWVLQAADGSAEAYLKMVLFDKIACALHEVGVSGELQVISGRWVVGSDEQSISDKQQPIIDGGKRTMGNGQRTMDNEPNTGHRSLVTDDLWASVQAELQLALPGRAWTTWLKDASLVGGENGQYLIEVRNEQAQDWVENRFAQLIVSIMAGLLGKRDFSVSVKSRS